MSKWSWEINGFIYLGEFWKGENQIWGTEKSILKMYEMKTQSSTNELSGNGLLNISYTILNYFIHPNVNASLLTWSYMDFLNRLATFQVHSYTNYVVWVYTVEVIWI